MLPCVGSFQRVRVHRCSLSGRNTATTTPGPISLRFLPPHPPFVPSTPLPPENKLLSWHAPLAPFVQSLFFPVSICVTLAGFTVLVSLMSPPPQCQRGLVHSLVVLVTSFPFFPHPSFLAYPQQISQETLTPPSRPPPLFPRFPLRFSPFTSGRKQPTPSNYHVVRSSPSFPLPCRFPLSRLSREASEHRKQDLTRSWFVRPIACRQVRCLLHRVSD